MNHVHSFSESLHLRSLIDHRRQQGTAADILTGQAACRGASRMCSPETPAAAVAMMAGCHRDREGVRPWIRPRSAWLSRFNKSTTKSQNDAR